MDYTSWPIVKLTEEKEAFLQQVVKEAMDSILSEARKQDQVREIIEKTVYQERIRITEIPWDADPKDDEKYWAKIKQNLLEIRSNEDSNEKKLEAEKELLKSIAYRYARQTVGNFKINAYKFAVFIVPILFNRLLNSITKGWIRGLFSRNEALFKKVELRGEVELVKTLHHDHTIVLLPTHFSNLDSVLLGYGIHLSGLPPFLYGAGLNLYNNRLVAYFIDRLGAYKLDRRKKNVIYLETLKAFSKVAMQRECHTLFFPGGTRSRSGALEDKLKLGLLSTVIDAQIENLLPNGNQKKIIVVPLVIGYNFVLEAPLLIKDHLKKTGKEKFYLEKRDGLGSRLSIFKLVSNFFSKESNILLSYGKPMDVMGNYVDFRGVSLDKAGREIDFTKYFISHQTLGPSKQRDGEYTLILAERIVEEYRKNNIVLASQAISFLAFLLLKKKFKDLDLYNLLRLNEEDRWLNYHEFLEKLHVFQEVLRSYESKDLIKLDDSFKLPLDAFVKEGLNNLGVFHANKVLFLNKSGLLTTEDMHLLYFYHNRLTGYDFESLI